MATGIETNIASLRITTETEHAAKEIGNGKPNANKQEASGGLSKFTCFSRLPKELQIDIWKFSLPGPRVVKLQYSGQYLETECASRARIPVALQVCQLSRETAQAEYKLSFGIKMWSLRNTERWTTIEPKIYFNFERDILFLDTSLLHTCEGLGGLNPVQLRNEACRFYQIIYNVQDLDKVERLAAWEYLPAVASRVIVRDRNAEIENPWDIFQGLKEPVMGIGIGCQSSDRDMREVTEVDLFAGKVWKLKLDLTMATKLRWKRTFFVPFLGKIPPLLVAHIRDTINHLDG